MAFELRSIETTREFDFGDAPDPTYPTKMSTNGAHHLIMPGIYLGSLLDGETDGFSDPDAMYDDNNGSNDEDGVLFASALSPGKTVEVSVAASAPGFLNGWVDFNFNGTWGDAGEQIFVDVVLEPGVNVLTVDVPEQAVIATTFARFRFETSDGHKRTCERWSVRTRLISSGIPRLNERIPASTWAMGNCSFAAARAPASVELVSPYTSSQSG